MQNAETSVRVINYRVPISAFYGNFTSFCSRYKLLPSLNGLVLLQAPSPALPQCGLGHARNIKTVCFDEINIA
jgi:hypothetical protein